MQGTLEQRGARCCRSVLHTHTPIQPTHFTSYILLLDPSLALVSPKTDQKRQHLNENLALHFRVFSGPGDYPTSDPMADTIPTGPARPAIGCPLDSRGEPRGLVWAVFGPAYPWAPLGPWAFGSLVEILYPCHCMSAGFERKMPRSGLASQGARVAQEKLNVSHE